MKPRIASAPRDERCIPTCRHLRHRQAGSLRQSRRDRGGLAGGWHVQVRSQGHGLIGEGVDGGTSGCRPQVSQAGCSSSNSFPGRPGGDYACTFPFRRRHWHERTTELLGTRCARRAGPWSAGRLNDLLVGCNVLVWCGLVCSIWPCFVSQDFVDVHVQGGIPRRHIELRQMGRRAKSNRSTRGPFLACGVGKRAKKPQTDRTTTGRATVGFPGLLYPDTAQRDSQTGPPALLPTCTQPPGLASTPLHAFLNYCCRAGEQDRNHRCAGTCPACMHTHTHTHACSHERASKRPN